MKKHTKHKQKSKVKGIESTRKRTPLVLETSPGDHIEHACKSACAKAISQNRNVRFTFNGKEIEATPLDSWMDVLRKWDVNYDPVKAAIYPDTAQEALRRWDDGQGVFTIEMGGLGPGYEQAIQLLVFELLRDNLDKPLPTKDEDWRSWGDATVHRINGSCGGFSGAQVGAAKNLAFHYLKDGYEATIRQFDNEKDRTIQVSNFWPHVEKSEGAPIPCP